jgi:hypothetical protein
MRETWLYPGEDFDWLKEIHGVSAHDYALAVLIGNEDAPEKVELFEEDHYLCTPVIVNLM